MNYNLYRNFALAASLAFLPAAVLAQTYHSSATFPAHPTGKREAMKMVKARAELKETLDAQKMQPGASFQAKLDKPVHLDNGTELPAGTTLRGTVATDDMNVMGKSKLALRFNSAQLEDGKVVPIKATIVGLYKPGQDNASAWGDMYTPPPNSWNDGTLAVDQLNISSGVDLHSKIASRNSGVFVTTKKDDVKLPMGSDMDLAIAARPGGQQHSTMQSGQ